MKVPRELRGVIEREYTPKMYHDVDFIAELDRRYNLAMIKHKRKKESNNDTESNTLR